MSDTKSNSSLHAHPHESGPPRYDAGATLTLTEIAELTGRDLKTIKTWNNKGAGCWPNAR